MFDEFSVFKSSEDRTKLLTTSSVSISKKLIKTGSEADSNSSPVKRQRRCFRHHNHHVTDMAVYNRYSTNSNDDDDDYDDDDRHSHTSDEDEEDDESEHEETISPESMFSFLALWESLIHLQPKSMISGENNKTDSGTGCLVSTDSNCNQIENRQRKLVFKQITKRFSYNISNIVNKQHAVNKSTLLFYIEWNCSQIKMIAPFDLLAYSRLTKMHMTKRRYSPLFQSYLSQNSNNKKLEFNYLSVKRLRKLFSKLDYDPLHDKFIKKNSLLLNCVSSQLSPYYLDIFRMSELQTIFDLEQIDFMENLRNKYNTSLDESAANSSQHRSHFTALTDHLVENIIWNCIVLFKFKLYQTPTDGTESQLFGGSGRSNSSGFNNYFINFYLSFFYIRTHMELVLLKIKDNAALSETMRKKLADLDSYLPQLLNALVLTGNFTQLDYHRLRRFCMKQGYDVDDIDDTIESSLASKTRRRRSIDLTGEYFKNVIKSVQPTFQTAFPLKLKDLCRIKIRNSLNQLDSTSIAQLNVTPDVQSFLLFDNEIRQILMKNHPTDEIEHKAGLLSP